MSTESSIKCPNCGELIDVNEILYHQLENEFKQKNLNEKKNSQFKSWIWQIIDYTIIEIYKRIYIGGKLCDI